MQVNLFSRPVLYLLAFFSIGFLVFYLALCCCNRLSADDHFFYSLQRSSGTWESILYLYQHWTPRSSSILWMDLLFSSFGTNAPMAASILNLLLCILVFYFLFQTIFRALFTISIQKKELILISICFTASFFFATANIAESWFWMCSSTAYITGILFLLGGCLLLLSEKNNAAHYLLLFLCFSFAACAAESYTVISGMILGILMIYHWRRMKGENRKIFSDPFMTKLLFSFFIFLAFSMFMFCSPGIQLRSEGLPHSPWLYSFYTALKGTARFFLLTMFSRYPALLICSLPFLAVGYGVSAKTKIRPRSSFFSKWLPVALLCLFLLTFFSALPSCMIMSEPPPPRALTHLFLFMAIASAALFTHLGMLIRERSGSPAILPAFITVPLLFIVIQACLQWPIAITYARAVDLRTGLLLKKETTGFTGTLTIDRLPPSGMICTDEISTDTAHHTNRYLRRDLGLDFDCVTGYPGGK
jgi:hypothetical protein